MALCWRAPEPGLEIEGEDDLRAQAPLERAKTQTSGERPCRSFASICAEASRPLTARPSAASFTRALVSVGVPKDDRFQVINEHDSKSFVFDLNYLDIRRSEDLVMIQITWNEGRTVEQKKALYKAIADGLAATLILRREDVFISLVEVKRENWSFGNEIT
jgi:4-oxalocrotonate tautomerase